MKQRSMYLKAMRVLAPIFLICGVFGVLVRISALTGNMTNVETGVVASRAEGWKIINSAVELLVMGTVVGAISEIGSWLRNLSPSGVGPAQVMDP